MNKLLTMILLTTFGSVFGQSQGDLNLDAGKKYKNADSTLNLVYDKILKEYSDTTFIKNLKESQQLWVKFRNSELKMKYPISNTYGSVQPMCVSLYLTDLTNDRIKTFQTWLDGIEEGDVCIGSVKNKNKSNCQFSNPDTSVYGIILLDKNSSIKKIGAMPTPIEHKNDLPHLNFCSQDKRQTMTLYFHPGGVVNEFAEFEVRNYSISDSAVSLKTNIFITGLGIKLSMTKEQVENILGKCYTQTTSIENLITMKYLINDSNNSDFLNRFNYPSYYAEYEFVGGNLMRFRFGFEYP